MIESLWKLTHDPSGTPRVLLAYTDFTDGELAWTLENGLDVVPLVDSARPFLRLTRNSVVTLSVSIYRDEALDTDARKRVMESLIAIPLLSKKPLRVEISGVADRYWQFSEAVISSHSPSRYMDPVSPNWLAGYSITATGLTQVGP